MATSRGTYPGSAEGRATRAVAEYDEGVGGWVSFAGVMLLIVGILNFIYGIAAIDKANFFVSNTQFVISDLSTWGWVMVVLGAIQVTAAGSLFVGGSWGRWVGIATAGLNAIAQLLWISSYPWLSLALFAIDVLVLYGLIARFGRRQPA
jgi:hypothetical protein